MPNPEKVRKPPRVVFSLGVPLPLERRAVKAAKRLKITRNAYICRALGMQLDRDESPAEPMQRSA